MHDDVRQLTSNGDLLVVRLQQWMVNSLMFIVFAAYAFAVWQDWHQKVIAGICFLYSTVMIHLVLIRRWENERKQAELQPCERTAGTGIQVRVLDVD
jgi:hypothetical protein